MRAAIAAIALAMVTACGNASDQYGGQWRDGPWQQPRLVGCSAELVVRAPTTLLAPLNEWFLEASPDNNCPVGILTVEGAIADYLPWVSPATRRELQSLLARGEKRAAEASQLVNEERKRALAESACRDLRVRIDPNHADPQTGALVAERMNPPQRGGSYEFQDRPIKQYGLTGFGRVLTRSTQIDPATGEERVTPIGLSYWKLGDRNGGSLWVRCHHPFDPNLGVCHIQKDHSRTVLVEYSVCMSLLPDWRAVDRAVGMIVDDWVVTGRVAKYVKKHPAA